MNDQTVDRTETPLRQRTPSGTDRLTPAVRRFRAFFRGLARWVERTLTRTTVIGEERLTQPRPVIFAANHASTYDAVLFIAHMPENTELVGPGDFKLLFPADLLIPLAGIVRIKRATLDRDSLRLMSGALEAGLNLALFPEGGTWEKRLEDAKTGVAYLAYQHQVPIVPVSFGGTYQVWRKIVTLQRPHITITIGEPLDPPPLGDRRERAAILDTVRMTLMQHIYAHLPPADQARYDVAARQVFHGHLRSSQDIWEGEADDFPVLAELVSKPNLISPLWRNARLPLAPLLDPSRTYPAAEFVIAAERLQHAFADAFSGYLAYRLGDAKAAAADAELAHLRALALTAHRRELRLRFTPSVTYAD